MTRTNAYVLVTVLVRVTALTFLLTLLLSMIPLAIQALQSDAEAGSFAWQLGAILVGVGVFFLVWLFADLLARAALVSPNDVNFDSDLDPTAWRSVCFAAIGVWFSATALLTLVNQGARWFYVQKLSEEYARMEWGELMFADVVTAIARLGIGLALLFGSRGLATLVRRMRDRDTPAPSA
jgi:hypothetical protein